MREVNFKVRAKTPYCLQAQLAADGRNDTLHSECAKLPINTSDKTPYCLQAQLGKRCSCEQDKAR